MILSHSDKMPRPTESPLARYELEDYIAVVTLDNPPRNVLDVAAKKALFQTFKELEKRLDEVRVVILAGAGPVFAAGGNIKAFLNLDPVAAQERLGNSHLMYALIENFPRPVIAVIHGAALGGGLELALCCDFRYAAKNVQLGFPETRLATMPGNGGLARCRYLLGEGRFKEMVYTGAVLNGDQAKECGLVEQVFMEAKLMDQALATARRIASRGPRAVAAAKRAINAMRDKGLSAALEIETREWAGLTATRDFKEGARAFLQKRRPDFQDE